MFLTKFNKKQNPCLTLIKLSSVYYKIVSKFPTYTCYLAYTCLPEKNHKNKPNVTARYTKHIQTRADLIPSFIFHLLFFSRFFVVSFSILFFCFHPTNFFMLRVTIFFCFYTGHSIPHQPSHQHIDWIA